MKLFNKSKETKPKTKKKEEIKKKPEKKNSNLKPAKIKEESTKKIDDLAAKSLVYPHISEKATDLAEKNKYVFRVFSNTNKRQIKEAVEKLYSVEVKSVNIVKIKRKKRRLGRIEGYKPAYKKAIVTLKEGYKIELVPR